MKYFNYFSPLVVFLTRIFYKWTIRPKFWPETNL